MASSSNSEPVVVLYKSTACRHCSALSAIWDSPPSKDEDSVVAALKKINPKIRIFIVTAKDNTGKFDENTAPKDLIRYGKWFPMILLVPGRLWDTAMSKLGPKNDTRLVEGVQIMNGNWDGDTLKYSQNYDIRKPSEFGRWLKEVSANDEFKKFQNNTSTQSGIVSPIVQTPPQPIQPLLSSIIRPTNTATSYVAAGSSQNQNSGQNSSHVERHSAMEPGGDICSLRIISRPK